MAALFKLIGLLYAKFRKHWVEHIPSWVISNDSINQLFLLFRFYGMKHIQLFLSDSKASWEFSNHLDCSRDRNISNNFSAFKNATTIAVIEIHRK